MLVYTTERTGAGWKRRMFGRLPVPLNLGHVPANSQRDEFWVLSTTNADHRIPVALVRVADPDKWGRGSYQSPKGTRVKMSDLLEQRTFRGPAAQGPVVINIDSSSAIRVDKDRHNFVSWLDEEHLVTLNASKDLMVWDIDTDTVSTVVSTADMHDFMKTNKLTHEG